MRLLNATFDAAQTAAPTVVAVVTAHKADLQAIATIFSCLIGAGCSVWVAYVKTRPAKPSSLVSAHEQAVLCTACLKGQRPPRCPVPNHYRPENCPLNKKRNMKIKILLLAAALSCMLASVGCASETFVKSTPVQVTQPTTNVVTVLATNVIDVTVFHTNEVGAVTPSITRTVEIQTNQVYTVTPAVWYTNVALTAMDTNIVHAAAGGATLAGVPFADVAGQGLLLLLGVGAGWLNNYRKNKALKATIGQKQTALDTALLTGKTLVENFEAIRTTALKIPEYAKIDDQVMGTIKTAQSLAGVKEIIHGLVEEHTDNTKSQI